jgi:hypothetical protein
MGRPKGGRYLLKDGSRVPSVTQVIGGNLGWKTDALCNWANKRGLEAELTGTTADTSDFSARCIEAATVPFGRYCEWRERSGFEPDILEQAIVSETLRVGGTPDAIGHINGATVLLDWKTSTGIYEDHVIQLAAYWEMVEEVHGVDLTEAQCARFGKDGSTEIKRYTWADLEPAFEAFKLLRRLHELKPNLSTR